MHFSKICIIKLIYYKTCYNYNSQRLGTEINSNTIHFLFVPETRSNSSNMAVEATLSPTYVE